MAASKGEQAMNLHLQEIESLQNSLREREKYVTELENRLRALWDKLEGERKHYMEHLQLNEELVSEIELENERLKEQNKRQNEAIDSLREMYAKDGKL
jgi:DNA repair exonuclease SbcCD ATPase subunit